MLDIKNAKKKKKRKRKKTWSNVYLAGILYSIPLQKGAHQEKISCASSAKQSNVAN